MSRTAYRQFVFAAFAVPLTAILLAGCATDSARERPVVSDKSVPLREPESAVRVVVPGDTLYSIAWESGRDYRELASWNRIAAPYTIKPGQQIRVTPPPPAEKAAAPAKAVAKRKDDVQSKPVPARNARAVSGNAKTSPAAAKPGTTSVASADKRNDDAAKASRTETGNKTGGQTKAKAAAPAAAAGKNSGAIAGGWGWPADGQTMSRYSESDSKGLDISGARGAPVRAAAGGRVVYRGSGLRGYGQLIIIKHNDEYLSAYAHNDRIYVKEGDVVKRGQKIADMGNTGSDRVKLHFEIRRQGTPVDPLKYLPKR